jgi:DNA-binding response OmpR family regulator
MRRDHSLLVIDDDDVLLGNIERFFQVKGFVVMTSNTALGVSRMIRSFHPDAIVLDQMMPAINGNRVAKFIRDTCGPLTPIILHSGSDPSTLLSMADETANTVCVPKGEGLEPLYAAICSALGIASLP